jgi:hypothetical protein
MESEDLSSLSEDLMRLSEDLLRQSEDLLRLSEDNFKATFLLRKNSGFQLNSFAISGIITKSNINREVHECKNSRLFLKKVTGVFFIF